MPEDSFAALPRPPAAILFDFDGVILQSAAIKSRAYLTLYENEAPEQLARIAAFQEAHSGVTRRIMIRRFEQEFFQRPGDAETVERLAEKFKALVFEGVVACPFVEGAEALLESAHGRVPMHLISGTPEPELLDILERRALRHYFVSVDGAPTDKPTAFARLLKRSGYRPADTLAVGDALTEYNAALALGIPFLAITGSGHAASFPKHVAAMSSLVGADGILGIVA